MPDVHLSDVSAIKREVPDYNPALEFEYTKRELLLLAEKMLLEDEKPCREDPAWLNADRYKHRSKHEIYCAAGTPDPAIASGLYWRTHPEGRRWRTPEERRGGDGELDRSFYR